jgi:lipopolysaccharide/colanic/teichoic acid biosynthesis glycosyltransferase
MHLTLLYVATSGRFWPFLHGQAEFMRACGFEIHVASSPGPQLDSFGAKHGGRIWPVHMSRGITPLADLAAWLRLWRLVRRRRPDIVHAHTPKAGLLGMLAACMAGVPARVYTIHGLVWQTRRGLARRLLIALEQVTCRLAHRVLCVSDSIRQSAIAAGLAPPEKIVLAANGSANGIDFGQFDPARIDPALNAYAIPPGAPVIGFVGRLVPDKGIADLDAAWRILREQFPSLHLLLIGEPEDHDPLPPGLLSRLERDPRVRFSGWQANMPGHYALLDVCVLPSRREGLPYAALEAAAMARPAVAFQVDGVVDAVEQDVTGLLVPPGDSPALADAVARLLRDPTLASQLGRQARARCAALYQQEPLWEFIYQQYREALRRPRLAWWKRPLDCVTAATLVVLLGPLLGIVALAVLATLGRPVLYRQRRPGLAERPFDILKFRTMRNGAASDRERLTPLGRLLRRTSLDELPQLLNILRGEMSFIGPRPLLERYLPFYSAGERRRHLVRPGLTGWAQIHGRNDLTWRERLAMDAWYAGHAGFSLDARIALVSIWQVLTRQGVQDDPSSAMPDLDVERQHA